VDRLMVAQAEARLRRSNGSNDDDADDAAALLSKAKFALHAGRFNHARSLMPFAFCICYQTLTHFTVRSWALFP
jgi:hypothetical protein